MSACERRGGFCQRCGYRACMAVEKPTELPDDFQTDLNLLGGFVLHLEDGAPLIVRNPLALARVLRRVLEAAYPDVDSLATPERRS